MAAPSPPTDYKKEVRFAVVMYGGVSLAIYINGVAQELFRLVRSTAPAGAEQGIQPNQNGDGSPSSQQSGEEPERAALSGSASAPPGCRLNGTERVYRLLSHLLSYDALRRTCQQLADEAQTDDAKKQTLKNKLDEVLTDDSKVVRTGFIVDILSGTSAGGINSIYLAKALANEQRIDRLKQLWIDEGDIELLLNDTNSLQGLGLTEQDPPQSLLNSRRMYFKLLKALDDMDRDNPLQPRSSPYAKELDLYITATDIEGVPVPLKLADKIVYERRHRHVFHFEYQDKVNDFTIDSNPFLAFAARCTSSFPFAFEPMRLADMDEVLDLFSNYRDKSDYKGDSSRWKKYFRDVDPKTGMPYVQVARRSFGDGGYLDNKPFSYAIEALVRRQSDVPVDRRLIYIEPSPEHPEDLPLRDLKPDALQNVKKALDLPSYETIREDLQKILQRNALIERVQRITSNIEKDTNDQLHDQLERKIGNFQSQFVQHEKELRDKLERSLQRTVEPNPRRRLIRLWNRPNITRVSQKDQGPSFLAYRKLRVSAVTEEIARLIARLLNIDSNSDLLLALRCLVRAWREDNYSDDRRDGKPDLTQFLTDFDLSHRLRRLNFLREKIDALYDYGWTTQRDLRELRDDYQEYTLKLLANITNPYLLAEFREQNADVHWMLTLLDSTVQLAELQEPELEELRKVLVLMKSEVNDEYKDLQNKARRLRQRRAQLPQHADEINPVLKPIEDIGITADLLKYIIDPKNVASAMNPAQRASWTGSPNEDDCLLVAQKVLEEQSANNNLRQKIETAVNALRESMNKAVVNSRRRMGKILDSKRKIRPKSKRGKDFFNENVHDELSWRNSKIVRAIREHLAFYYYNFEEYDQISFPIFYEADVGEASTVEVIRVSPEDATTLIDERREKLDSPTGKGRQKLAGVSLHHFGAFLDRTWRQNDIMWGRLDGFERLVTALLPTEKDKHLRNFLIEEGHTSILLDELPPEGRLQLGGLVSEALIRASSGEAMQKAVAQVTRAMRDGSPLMTRLEKIIRHSLTNEELLGFIRDGYEVNRKLDPKPLLATISRSTQIIGKVFEDVANANQLDGKNLAWIARLGKLFWGLVEVAVPNTLKNMMLGHWLSVLYAFEVFVIFGGLFLSSQSALQFGWTSLGITLVLNIIVLVLKDVMRGRRAVLNMTGLIVGLVLLGLSAVGLLEILGPVFKITWGADNLYPMYWVKETIKAHIPGGRFVYQNVFSLALLIGVIVLSLLMNKVFSLVDFSWLDLRLKYLKRLVTNNKWGTVVNPASFKPITLISEMILDTTRPLPGQKDVYLLSFVLSAVPSNHWSSFFESFLKTQNTDDGLQVAINNREVVVMAPEPILPTLIKRLNDAVNEANKDYKAMLDKAALAEIKNLRDRIAINNRLQSPAGDGLPEGVRTILVKLRDESSKTLGTGALVAGRLIGFLMLLMGAGLLYGLINVGYVMYKHPEAKFPGRLHNPAMAIELVRSPEEAAQVISAQAIMADSSPQNAQLGIEKLRRGIRADWFLISYFTIVIGAFCFWASKFHREIDPGLTRIAMVFVLGAAVFDVLENLLILQVLNASNFDQPTINWLTVSTTLKWMVLFFLLALIGRLFRKRSSRIVRVVGLLMLITSVVGLLGIAGPRIAVEIAFWLMAIDVLLAGAVLLIQPRLIGGFRKLNST